MRETISDRNYRQRLACVLRFMNSHAFHPLERPTGRKSVISEIWSKRIEGEPPESLIRENRSSDLGLAPKAEWDLFPEASHFSATHTSDSDQAEAEPKQLAKCKHKSRHTMSESISQKNLLFDPEDIIHPRSTEWVPCMEVAHYVQERLRKSFDKDVHSTLHSECPCLSLLGKLLDTPDVDPSVVTFLKKFAKGPKKGLDRAWRGCQDKLLDISGPIAKLLRLSIKLRIL
ncbi:hypothetical protein NDU88_004739 [Pleurodeles waltl]|uniref:Uncharacterized protein n=1 Tax=Pleurodeles waltl TaxID=8319 RepID=A0AAV7LMM9_PLEWA|nr:hypothetical protein NDU88_004739 [Pleurodeles waltl]